MTPPPDPRRNDARGDIYGQLLQAHDIHGSVTVNASPEPAAAADVSLDPPRLASVVRGRADLLAELQGAMVRGAPMPHVLTGAGGFGKTTVAAALAEHARREDWTVFWVRPDAIVPSMLEAAIELGGSRTEAEEVKNAPRQAARWAWRHLDSAPEPWLLVIDNADRPEDLDPQNRPGEQRGWMRSSPGGFVLVTTRVDDPALWAPATVHRLDPLTTDEAARALADHVRSGELPGAAALAERLGGVPLALSLAGRILATYRVLFPDARSLLSWLEENVTGLDELATPLVSGQDGDRQLLSGVWDMSLRLVAEREPKAAPVLHILSVLGGNAVPVPLRRLPVAETASDELLGLDEAGLARTINALVIHGLVDLGRRSGELCLRLHPLVSETVRANLMPESLPLLETVERLLSQQADRDLTLEMGAYAALHDLLVRLHGDAHPDAVRVDLLCQRSMMLLGYRQRAEENLRAIVERAGDCLGENHPETVRAQHALADALRALDKIEEAEQVYRTAADRRESVLGPAHPDTLSSRHQVALMAGLRGDLDTAEEGFGAVWRQYVERSEEEARTALHALENLAYVAMYKGEHDTAESGFHRVREVRSRSLGPLHKDTVVADYHLARVAFERGDYRRASERFEKVVALNEDIFGEDHPITSQAREWLDRTRQRLSGD